MKKDQNKIANLREEFSVEFGDVNGTKLFDFPLRGQNHSKNDQKIKEEKPV